MNKANANHIKTFEIKLALWLAPLLPPKEVAKVVTSNGGKGGQGQEAKAKAFKRPNLNLFIFAIFLPTLLSKNLSLHSSFNYEKKAKIFFLKNNSKV